MFGVCIKINKTQSDFSHFLLRSTSLHYALFVHRLSSVNANIILRIYIQLLNSIVPIVLVYNKTEYKLRDKLKQNFWIASVAKQRDYTKLQLQPRTHLCPPAAGAISPLKSFLYVEV